MESHKAKEDRFCGLPDSLIKEMDFMSVVEVSNIIYACELGVISFEEAWDRLRKIWKEKRKPTHLNTLPRKEI
jgi:hypothetical protein